MPIVHNTNEEYHSSEGVSKSGLWEIYDKTPYHFKFGKKEHKSHFDLGEAAHIAILEPEKLETLVTRGPTDRRGNKWKNAQDFAAAHSTILLTEGDHDQVLAIRDKAATVPQIRLLQGEDTMREVSAYHTDEETGVTVRCRPDIYAPRHKLIGDIKTVASASYEAFSKSVGKFGWHVQDAVYTDVWSKGAELDVEGFFFIAFEKSEPPMVAVFELDANAVREGHAIYRRALQMYKDCEDRGEWPGYSGDVQTVSLKQWDYRETTPTYQDE